MPKSSKLTDNQITKSEFIAIVRRCSTEAGIVLPDDFDKDADDLIPTIDSFNEFRQYVCDFVRAKLNTDVAFRKKYFEIYKSISETVRINVLKRLDIEAYANKPLRSIGMSPRQILGDFLLSLAEGQYWNTATLKRWKTDEGGNAGKVLCNSLFNNFGVVSDSILSLLIGEGSASALLRNPIDITPQSIKTEYDAAYYLIEFLKSRPKGPWKCAYLLNWRAADGTRGHCLKQWVLKNRAEWSAQVVGDLLSGNGKLLSDHPFSKKGF